MIDHWAAGRDLDAGGDALPPDLSWQAELWRRLRQRLDAASPPDRLRTALARLRDHPDAIALPPRLSVFGLTRLAPDHLQVLTTLGRHRDVHLWLPHPSPALWAATSAALDSTGARIGPRAEDDTVQLARHRLLGYLGRDSRELQLVPAAAHRGGVGTSTTPAVRHGPTPCCTGCKPTSPPTPIRSRSRRRLPSGPVTAACRSTPTHGPDRQVEVLREVLVGLLADDPTLEPRDIVVMCPDIERFAPLISAGVRPDRRRRPRPSIPATDSGSRLADRALRQVNPLLSVLSQVLDLADTRVDRLGAARPGAPVRPVARRFGFTDDDLGRLAELVGGRGVRWGLDAAHRRAVRAGDFGQNTWAAGLDRLLLGVAMDAEGDHFIGTALPLDDVDSSDVDLVGRLAELVEPASALVDAASPPRHSVPDWLGWPHGDRGADRDQSPRTAGRSATRTRAGPAAATRRREQTVLSGRSSRRCSPTASAVEPAGPTSGPALSPCAPCTRCARSRTGWCACSASTTAASRAAPGPTATTAGAAGFVRRPRPSQRGSPAAARRDHDRRGSPGDHLQRRGLRGPARHVRPRCPIGELLDTLDRTVVLRTTGPSATTWCRQHPLQPFDTANFGADRSSEAAQPFSFDVAALRGAGRSGGPVGAAVGLGPEPIAARDHRRGHRPADLRPSSPTRLERCCGTAARSADDRDDGPGPTSCRSPSTGLESWAIGDRLLSASCAAPTSTS